MTQLDRLKLIFAAIADDVKAILTKQGDITQLTTTNKTNFVAVINEVITNKGIGTNTDTTTTTGFTDPTL